MTSFTVEVEQGRDEQASDFYLQLGQYVLIRQSAACLTCPPCCLEPFLWNRVFMVVRVLAKLQNQFNPPGSWG